MPRCQSDTSMPVKYLSRNLIKRRRDAVLRRRKDVLYELAREKHAIAYRFLVRISPFFSCILEYQPHSEEMSTVAVSQLIIWQAYRWEQTENSSFFINSVRKSNNKSQLKQWIIPRLWWPWVQYGQRRGPSTWSPIWSTSAGTLQQLAQKGMEWHANILLGSVSSSMSVPNCKIFELKREKSNSIW
jgi:hypothetical protein